jgi:SAM-dependent methyltransferase
MSIRNWKLKGVIQKVLSIVPGGGHVNNWLQLKTGGLKNFEQNISDKVADWELMMGYLARMGRRIEGQVMLEIGSGWYPTLPVCHALGGAAAIHTVDIVRHMNPAMTFRMVRALEPMLDRVAAGSGASIGDVRRRFEEIAHSPNLAALLAAARIDYRAPEDASAVQLPDRSVDVVYSNSVLEHVTPSVIGPIMREARRVLKDDGLSVHAVACNDHYAHLDRSISFVNFLRFTEKEWRFWNNRFNYQSRLRAVDYTRIAEEAGFCIEYEGRAVRPGCREALKSLPIAPEFRHYSHEDLATTTIDFVAVKRP